MQKQLNFKTKVQKWLLKKAKRRKTKRKIAKRLPIVIINNQIVNTSQTQIAMGNTKESGDFFEAYNLARHTV